MLDLNMPRNEIVARTFPIRYHNFEGTCFTMDVKGRQYIITAKHVVEGIDEVDEIEVGRSDKWVTFTVSRVDCAPSTADIIVLAPNTTVSASIPEVVYGGGWFYGQDVIFIGFPFGFVPADRAPAHLLPLCKKATMSNQFQGSNLLILSGQSNEGFSGAPVFYYDSNNSVTHVIGVLTADIRQLIHELRIGTDKEEIFESAGFIQAVPISHALDAIKLRPIGADIR